MKKTYTIVCNAINIAYSFTDEKTKEKKEGTSHYAVIVENRDGIPVRVKLYKTSPDFFESCSEGDVVSALYFDEYQRLVGVRV